ncbi:MAG TPA: hypothetical protein VG736_13195 [Vicinamibacterales bacterium]|nr:hypothetical protein [Vicinamibacterales bacterium]
MRQSLDSVTKWLLDGDPAIRWQTLRDLVGASKGVIEQERRKVASDGWGARLLARQDAEGTWSGGLYSPKWTSTTYTLLLLRDFGLGSDNQQAQKACTRLLDRGLQRDGGINYGGRGRSETCITGMVLSILSLWLLIAVGGDYVFIVKAFKPPDGYYKLDVYLYYALTLAIPLVAGWRRDAARAFTGTSA